MALRRARLKGTDDMAARRNAQTTSKADALAAASMLNDFLGGTADVAAKAVRQAGQEAAFLESAGEISTFLGGTYTLYQGYVALSTGSSEAAYDAGFGSLTLAVSRIPVAGPSVAFGMTVGSIIGQLVSPPPREEGSLSKGAPTGGQCTPRGN